MKQEIIEKYVEKILGNQLNKLNVKDKTIEEIKDSVRNNMYSIVFNWNNIDYRKAILITAMEEGKFYEPEADIDIKCFVVVTIRNSYLEQICSDDCHVAGMDKPIEEKEIKIITKEAIEYFKNINFEDMAKCIKLSETDDKYGNIIKKYPMAWKSLIELAKCTGKRKIYDREIVKEKIKIKDIEIYKSNKSSKIKNNVKEVESGITEELSSNLIEVLKNIIQEKGNTFYVDSFKMLTRNFEKLLKVIEILLENEEYFLTSNYIISDNYVGKRNNLYRAAHTTNEVLKKMKDINFLNDLSKTHRIVLKNYVDHYFS